MEITTILAYIISPVLFFLFTGALIIWLTDY